MVERECTLRVAVLPIERSSVELGPLQKDPPFWCHVTLIIRNCHLSECGHFVIIIKSPSKSYILFNLSESGVHL